MNEGTRNADGRDISDIMYVGIPILCISILALFRISLAGWILAVISFILGAWLMVGSIKSVPFPWLVINWFVGGLLLIPLIYLMKISRQMKSGGK